MRARYKRTWLDSEHVWTGSRSSGGTRTKLCSLSELSAIVVAGVAVSVSMSCRLAQVLFVLFSLSLSLPLCLWLALHVLCNKWAQLTQSKISEYYQSCMQVHACACWSIGSKRVSRPHMKHIKVVREIKKAKRNSLSGEREMLFRMIHKCLNVHCWVK